LEAVPQSSDHQTSSSSVTIPVLSSCPAGSVLTPEKQPPETPISPNHKSEEKVLESSMNLSADFEGELFLLEKSAEKFSVDNLPVCQTVNQNPRVHSGFNEEAGLLSTGSVPVAKEKTAAAGENSTGFWSKLKSNASQGLGAITHALSIVKTNTVQSIDVLTSFCSTEQRDKAFSRKRPLEELIPVLSCKYRKITDTDNEQHLQTRSNPSNKPLGGIRLPYLERMTFGIPDAVFLNHVGDDPASREIFLLKHRFKKSLNYRYMAHDKSFLMWELGLCLAYYQGDKYLGYRNTAFLFSSKYECCWYLDLQDDQRRHYRSVESYKSKEAADQALVKWQTEKREKDNGNMCQIASDIISTVVWIRPLYRFEQRIAKGKETEDVTEYEFTMGAPNPEIAETDTRMLTTLLEERHLTVYLDTTLQSSDPDYWISQTKL
jgi:hypothetical protein